MRIILITSSFLILFISACSTIVLEPADFSWPIESVIKVDDDGFISEDRYSFSVNVKNLFFAELNDSSAYLDRELRVIRDIKGYYFITGNNFKNVYVFSDDDGKMKLTEKILISETGINKPVFNQRQPYIELLDGNKSYFLSSEGIKEDE